MRATRQTRRVPIIADILRALEEIAPTRYAFDFDHIGLQVGDPGNKVERAIVSLDRSLSAIAFAERSNAQLLLAHHPLIWDPLKSLLEAAHNERSASRLIRSGIAFIGAHTNWDCAPGGVNDTLAARLGLTDVEIFGAAAPVPMRKLVGFAPAEAVDAILDAASKAGAGGIGEYTRCAFLTPGTGTFKGSEVSNPAVGQAGKQESVPEVRFEMVVPADRAAAVVRAATTAHPYEEPAFDLFDLAPAYEQPIGRIGSLPSPLSFTDFVSHCDRSLATKALGWGESGRSISRVAVIGGAADDEWQAAKATGADVYLTGEVRQHIAMEASESGLALVAAGHYATEHPGCEELCRRMQQALPEIEWRLFEPKPGEGGRPL